MYYGIVIKWADKLDNLVYVKLNQNYFSIAAFESWKVFISWDYW